jgi:hypothetical protein
VEQVAARQQVEQLGLPFGCCSITRLRRHLVLCDTKRVRVSLDGDTIRQLRKTGVPVRQMAQDDWDGGSETYSAPPGKGRSEPG